MNIKYIKGDATQPQGKGMKIICHVCNDIGVWGAGFVLALSKRWSYPEHFYRARQKYPLGHVDILSVETDIYVANMIAQHGLRSDSNTIPLRYIALAEALSKVNELAENIGAELHMPRIGCGLAGGSWEAVESVIRENVHVDVWVYDL